jgi:hypothetical protein
MIAPALVVGGFGKPPFRRSANRDTLDAAPTDGQGEGYLMPRPIPSKQNLHQPDENAGESHEELPQPS